jgi:hypothetical protein
MDVDLDGVEVDQDDGHGAGNEKIKDNDGGK